MDTESAQGLRKLVLQVGGVGVVALLFAAVLGSGEDAGTVLSIFSTRFLGIFIEAVPFLLLGTLVSGLIDSFISADDIARWIPRNPVLATFAGTFMGFAFPVCECGVVPVVRRLFTKGLPMSVGVAFLLAAPVINPIVLAGTYAAFGVGPVLIGRFVLTAVVAILVGLVFAFAARPQEVLQPGALVKSFGRSPVPVGGGGGGGGGTTANADFAPAALPVLDAIAVPTRRKPLIVGLRDALLMAGSEFFEMGRYLVIGTLLAATMQTLISQDVLLALGRGPVVSVVAMQLLAFVLSVCSTVDAFLALAFAGTFTTGSILAFLVFGPMVDIKSTLMFMGVFKQRVVIYLIALPFLLTLLFGVWLNLNIAW
ncbi:MAG: permease [bacterium]|nr:permease [bacterium]